jgi:hypothetical protein
VTVDEGASDAQARAVERIWMGKEGGSPAEVARAFEEYLGFERAAISLSDGATPTIAVEGRAQFRYEPFRGEDGRPTTLVNSLYGGRETEVGRSVGSASSFGISLEASFGLATDFEMSSGP